LKTETLPRISCIQQQVTLYESLEHSYRSTPFLQTLVGYYITV
jgi:hypothetical protein